MFIIRLSCLLAIGAAASAQEGPLATQVPWEPVWTSPGPISLPLGDETVRQTVEIPKPPFKEGATLCLRFQARLHTPSPAGWNNYLGLEWNGVALESRTSRNTRRVLNRRDPIETKHPNYPLVALWAPRGVPCLQVFFGPPNHEVDSNIISDRQEGYWYLLDIGDMPLSDDVNRLTISNTAIKSYWNGVPPADLNMVIEDLSFGFAPQSAVRELQQARLVRREALADPRVTGPGIRMVMRKGAGLQVNIDAESYFIESAFSFPQDGKMGFNRLLCMPETEGEEGWAPEIKTTPSGQEIRAEGESYRLVRRIVRAEPRIEIADTLTNKTDQILGVAVRHEIITPDYPKRASLGGLATPVLGAGASAENPTVFVAQETTGLGMVAEDDAMRLQMARRVDDNAIKFGTDRLGLAPGESYTMQWALYPSGAPQSGPGASGGPDYFAFINQVRRDWDVNFTIEGPFDFFDTTRVGTPEGQASVRQSLERKKMKLFALTPWFEYYNGWTIQRDEYKKQMQAAQAFIKSVSPDAKCLACIETNLVPMDLSFFKDSIPKEGWPIGRDKGGKYGQTATREITACVDASPWRDSCLRDADGNVLLDCWYVQHYASKPALNLMVYPTLENHRNEHMLEQIAWLLDDVGLDGVYIDQFSLSWNDDATRYSKERWDGRTVNLGPDGRVASTMCDLGLISAPARRGWVEAALKRGKTVVCNTNPTVAELQRLPAFRFMETQGYEPLSGEGAPDMQQLAKGQLGSPIGLGYSFPATAGADFFIRTVIAHLRYGMLYYYYATDFPAQDTPEGRPGGEFGPVNHMFPFTPVELHEGWVLGKERLITAVSGEFPWPYDREPKITQFDTRGRERPPDVTVAKNDSGGYRIKLSLRNWWEIAVVE